MIVLDASVLIAHLDADDPFHHRATDLLVAAVSQPLRASAVTVAEVLVRPVRLSRLADAQRSLDQLRLKSIGIQADQAERLAVMRAATGLKLPDCCVLLAAEDVRAGVVLTFDERLERAAKAAGYATAPA